MKGKKNIDNKELEAQR